MWCSSLRAGISAVTEIRPDGRVTVASERSGRAARIARTTSGTGDALRGPRIQTNDEQQPIASAVTSAATTSVGVGVEYTSTHIERSDRHLLRDGRVHSAACGQQHRRRHRNQAAPEDQSGHRPHQPRRPPLSATNDSDGARFGPSSAAGWGSFTCADPTRGSRGHSGIECHNCRSARSRGNPRCHLADAPLPALPSTPGSPARRVEPGPVTAAGSAARGGGAPSGDLYISRRRRQQLRDHGRLAAYRRRAERSRQRPPRAGDLMVGGDGVGYNPARPRASNGPGVGLATTQAARRLEAVAPRAT